MALSVIDNKKMAPLAVNNKKDVEIPQLQNRTSTAVSQETATTVTCSEEKVAAVTVRQDTAETSTTTCSNESSTIYTYEEFRRGKQLRRLLLNSLIKWFITVTLCVSIYGVLLAYSSHEALLWRKKREFNTLIIALTIMLSLNITSALKSNAMELQWWLLSLRRYKPREADLIMSSEHFTTMLKLGWTTRHTLIQIFVAVFVTMNIVSPRATGTGWRAGYTYVDSTAVLTTTHFQGSQIALALLGITYNINPADKFTVTKPGFVSIADLTDIQGTKVLSPNGSKTSASNGSEEVNTRRYSANSFGQIGLAFGEDFIWNAPKPGALYNPDLSQVFFTPPLGDNDDDNDPTKVANGTASDELVDYTYTFIFAESTLSNASYAATAITNRSVSVVARCDSYKVIVGGNGSSANITVHSDEGDGVAYLPVANGGSQILYLHDPQLDAHDTWSHVSAFEPSDTDPWFYSCNVTLGNVTNGVIPAHYMGVNFTRYVPAAIALQGYGATEVGLSNTTTNFQFQSYPSQSYFGQPAAGNGTQMARLMSRYAINALTACAQVNTNIDAWGMQPQRGIVLEITRWRYLHTILGLTMGLQLLVQIAAVLVANRVQVREQRSLANVALLRPLLAGVSDRASMAPGRQIARLIGKGVTLRYEPVGAGYDVVIYRDGGRRNGPRRAQKAS